MTLLFAVKNDLNINLDMLNGCHKSIKFTLKSESNTKFHFLDVL